MRLASSPHAFARTSSHTFPCLRLAAGGREDIRQAREMDVLLRTMFATPLALSYERHSSFVGAIGAMIWLLCRPKLGT